MSSAITLLPLLAFAGFGAVQVSADVVVERSLGDARIERIASLPTADLVVLDSGHEAGLREGMVCTVSRSGQTIGELLLVDLRLRASSALILDLASDRTLQPGDRVSVKTVSSR